MNNLILIGFMGTGKSTVGRLLAARLGRTFFDTDMLVEAEAGCTISDLFAVRGEAGFRQIERAVIADLADLDGAVIATGGGAPHDPVNAENLRRAGRVFWLKASPETVLARVGDARSRPLLAGAQDPLMEIRRLSASREEAYARTAHTVIDTDTQSPEAVARLIQAHCTGGSG